MAMKLYGYWRSSSSYRVRIALNLKGLDVEHAPVNLIEEGGEQHADAYRALNPAEKVPALVLDDGRVLTQSLAIIEYLDECWPEPALLPGDPMSRARIRAFASLVACDIQPLGNLAVLNHVREAYGQNSDGVKAWARLWIERGLAALEALGGREAGAGPFIFGEAASLAEVALVPQLYNARRFDTDLTGFPRLCAADEAARAHSAFAAAAPENQPDAPNGG